MPEVARRSLLAGLSAAPAALVVGTLPAAVQALPVSPVRTTLDDVAELTRLYEAAGRRREAADAAWTAATERMIMPPVPDALFLRARDPIAGRLVPARWAGRLWFGSPDRLAVLRGWSVTSLEAANDIPFLARRAEILAAYAEWQGAIRAAEDTAGVTETDAEMKAAWEHEKPIRMRILELRSTDPAALRLKVRVYLSSVALLDWRSSLDENIAKAIDEDGGPWEDAFAASILRDIVTALATADT